MTPRVILLNARQIWLTLIGIDIFFMLAHLLITRLTFLPDRFIRLFALNAEQNVPTWFSGIQLALLGLIAVVLYLQSTLPEQHWLRRFYGVMAGIYFFFSIDEFASIHEHLNQMFGGISLSALPLPPSRLWLYLYPLAFAVILAFFAKGLVAFLRDPRGTNAYLVGAVLFFSGGVILEIIGHYVHQSELRLTFIDSLTLVPAEGLELLGQSTMIYALLVKMNPFQSLLQTGVVLDKGRQFSLSPAGGFILSTCLVANRRWRGEDMRVDYPQAFVIMPFSETWSNDDYVQMIKPAVESAGLACVRGETPLRVGDLMGTIWDALMQSGL